MTLAVRHEHLAEADPRAVIWDAHVGLQLGVLEDFGVVPAPSSRLLDFGCGEGRLVRAWRASGYDARGCDFEVPQGVRELSRILDPYRLPYADEEFDVVLSDQVLEHVADYDAALSEIRRVLRRGGIAFHLFPARWRPIEPHVFVPFAGVLRSRWWLAFWAALGVRNGFQQGLSRTDVVARNAAYLHRDTNYVSTREIERVARHHHFDEVVWAEEAVLRHAYGRARTLSRVVGRGPSVARIYRHAHMRALVTR